MINKILNFFGFAIFKKSNYKKAFSNEKKDIKLLEVLNNAKGILHLGAHRGDEAEVYNWFNKKVIWFEANPDIFIKLKDNLKVYRYQDCFCALLGNEEGVYKDFYISNNDSASSSIFQFSKETLSGKYFPGRKLKMNKKKSLKMRKLDNVLEENQISLIDYDHWVIDLQGAELLALKGAENSIKFCNSIYIEVSNVDIYHGGVKWEEIKSWLNERNFFHLNTLDKNHTDILFIRND
tara:strand:- start:742 stop:1449 length:708 start_codon:yes stop_codon:yes gene_type:complete